MINTKNLRELDCICTASPKLIGRAIRLLSAHLIGLNPIQEALRLQMANHAGIIVFIEGNWCCLEMLPTGLELNPINDYIVKRDKIVSIKRLGIFDNPDVRDEARKFLMTLWNMAQTEYGTAKIFRFLGINSGEAGRPYCSELAEIVANKHRSTWSKWQLTRHGKKSRIAPCEIQYGTGREVSWNLP